MFEVIICKVKTGKVERKLFDTRDEADQYLAKREEQLLRPRREGHCPRSLRDFRMEIHYRETPAVQVVLAAAA
jgi:hypothetical protein